MEPASLTASENIERENAARLSSRNAEIPGAKGNEHLPNARDSIVKNQLRSLPMKYRSVLQTKNPFQAGCIFHCPLPSSGVIHFLRGKAIMMASALLILWSVAPANIMAASAKNNRASLQLKSDAFKSGDAIPSRYTCEGKDTSPALSWTDPPAGTKSFTLIVTDPDAPAHTWVHWVIYDLPASARSIREGVPKVERIPGGAVQGSNDFNKLGYGGPCPPSGKPHRYFFHLYALDTRLNLKPGATREEVEQAMKGHILAEGELMGLYGHP
ncbi:MAG TPA: YbhB/YbcL family Raf kinase inhibitor-like protein [Terriglobia bacterium]|nr:YbhB/YbcL family Raf kinase inhibitor-like protein [Terriglobia bacterium]